MRNRADESAVEWLREQIQSKTVELRSLEMAKSKNNNDNEKDGHLFDRTYNEIIIIINHYWNFKKKKKKRK